MRTAATVTMLARAMLACIAALLLASAPPALAQCGTTVPGGSVVGQTWTEAGSPYCVTGDLFISNLTIEPGVTVLVDGPWRLNIQTTIHAEGTAEAPIVFTAKDPAVSKWKGMEFNQTVPGSVLRHCHFLHATDAAIGIFDATPEVDACLFTSNEYNFSGNAFGGAVRIDGTAGGVVRIAGCSFVGNIARSHAVSFCNGFVGGGGAIAVMRGDVIIDGSLFRQNSAESVGACGDRRARGGAVYIDTGEASVLVSNSIFGGNVASGPNESSGGGIYIASGDVTITNVTVARNNRAGLHVAGGDVAVRNSIFWQNNDGGDQIAGEPCVDYSIVQNGWDGACGSDNIAFNPAFAGAGTTLCDLTILDGSPCIDAGDPDPAYNDSAACSRPPYGRERNDMGAHGGPGACWTALTCPSRANLNGDCDLDFFDFLEFQDLFAAGDPRADFDDSGSLDFFDFLAFQDIFAAGCP